MEINTGVAISLVSEETVYSSFMKDLPCQSTDVVLHTYTGESVPVLGKLMIKVEKDEAVLILPLLVVKGSSMTLMVRDWLQKLKFDWKKHFQPSSFTEFTV